MDRFTGFSPESFEQLARALALKVFGAGVTAFGDGPDGGREAMFRGRVPYPHPPSEQWEGYGVIQAKFKSKTEGTARDQAWALQQLRGELQKWRTAKRAPKPEFFVFVTNVSLTSRAGGGKDQASKILAQKRNRLKGFAIWDANQLIALIDGFTEIRQRFTYFFTTGDLLAAFASQLPNQLDAETILRTYLSKEFISDEDARLSQAGDRSEDRIRLADVFVDLPVDSDSPLAVEEDERELPLAVQELLAAGSRKLDPLSLMQDADPAHATSGSKRTIAGRFVYLGGPGSGKSTIGQFLAQIHRAALLERVPVQRLEENVTRLLAAFKARCVEDSFAWPTTPRYPFRIELNAFAKSLAAQEKGGAATLSEYIRQQISKNSNVSHSELRRWLACYPCLLIFDGLDEVPASSNRKAVIAAIQEFLSEARDVEADILVVASSRPDGYAGEFDGSEVHHKYLTPLPREGLNNSKSRVAHAGAIRGISLNS